MKEEIEIRSLAWLKERIGKEVYTTCPTAYNGPMVIKDDYHASYLHAGQTNFMFRFKDMEDQKPKTGTQANLF